MSGQAVVMTDDNTWVCEYASTWEELSSGLSNIESIPPYTGILFDMGSDQYEISINMEQMLFNIDILFIGSEGGVVGILRNVAPRDSVSYEGEGVGCRFFMEVNAGELGGIVIGDTVSIQIPEASGVNLGDFVMLMVVAGLSGTMIKTMLKKDT